MEYTVALDRNILNRYIASATLCNRRAPKKSSEVKMLIDTGAFNTMIDSAIIADFGILLPLKIPIAIGGAAGETQACMLHRIEMGNFVMENVFAMAYPFKDWLSGHIILGLNVMNNWDFCISRADHELRFTERISEHLPNKTNLYQNYFRGSQYVATQIKEGLNDCFE